MKIDFFSNNFLTKLSDNIIDKKNNNYPKISIVMPSYNQVQFIERSILSILNQDYSNTELIIIDGGSEDGTIEIIKKYEDKNLHIVRLHIGLEDPKDLILDIKNSLKCIK